MLVFNNKSWHYKLILYTWGRNFFIDTEEMDWKAIEKIDSTKLKNMHWSDFPRLEKTKTVNFCPYCRALVAGVITLPFVWLWRKYPHKPKKERTHAEIMKSSEKRSKIVKTCVASAMVAFGIWHIAIGDSYLWGVFYFGIAAFNLKSSEVLKWTAMHLNKIHLPKWKRKDKPKKAKQKRTTPEFFKKLAKKHDVICPPVYFVDMKQPEALR